MQINFIDLKKQYALYKDEIQTQVNEVLSSCQFILGPQVLALEKKMAAFVGVKEAVSCASGTDALLMALLAYDIQPGDEIITTPFSFIAAAEMIRLLHAKPVFVDIDPETFNIDADFIIQAVSSKTRGIIAIDLFGQCAEYDRINKIAKEKGLFVIEDAAQSFGAKYKGRLAGSLTDIACTSFFPAKPLGCYGDGGMIFTDQKDLADKMRSIRMHGCGTDRYEHINVGINGRMDTLQAAILDVKLKHYPEEIKLRSKVAQYYSKHLKAPVQTPVILSHNESVFAQYVIKVPKRDALKDFLQEKGIPTAIHYPKVIHRQPPYQSEDYPEGSLPIAEMACRHVLALPFHPFLTAEEQDFIIEKINTFYKKRGDA